MFSQTKKKFISGSDFFFWHYTKSQESHVSVLLKKYFFKVIIEGVWGNNRASGFIAVDDVTFYEGKCMSFVAYLLRIFFLIFFCFRIVVNFLFQG
jgi:hypothetical protein